MALEAFGFFGLLRLRLFAMRLREAPLRMTVLWWVGENRRQTEKATTTADPYGMADKKTIAGLFFCWGGVGVFYP